MQSEVRLTFVIHSYVFCARITTIVVGLDLASSVSTNPIGCAMTTEGLA